MKDMGIVTGSAEQAKPLIIGKTTVYEHTNIQKVTEPDKLTGKVPDNLYRYHEIQYGKDEYIELVSEKESKLRSDLDYLAIMTDTEIPE